MKNSKKPINYVYHMKRRMSGRLISKTTQNRYLCLFSDGSKLQVVPGLNAKIISEADWKWISGAESKKWKHNKTQWDKYQTSRAQKIISAL